GSRIASSAEIRWRAPRQKCCGDRAVQIQISAAFDESERHHRIRDHPKRAPRYLRPRGQFVERAPVFSDVLEEADLGRNEQMLRGHESGGDLKYRIRRDWLPHAALHGDVNPFGAASSTCPLPGPGERDRNSERGWFTRSAGPILSPDAKTF